jgi:2-polyprenyl-3-methyl-5-hydroxy-6-metoxy-1,4-benzoquinol methylase
MSQRIHYTNCPVCGSLHIFPFLSVSDYTVSKEEFPVDECKDCSARFTQNIPVAEEIGPYYKSEEYISHTDTSKGLINRLYQSVRNRTVKQKRKLIERITAVKRGKLLDVGSGTGFFAAEMQKNGWQVVGLEPDADARKVAAASNNIILQDLKEFFQLPVNSFDAITLWHVLEHVHELHDYMDRLKLLLKDEGKLIIAVPNYTAKDAVIYGRYWAAYDVPRHLYHFSPKAMKVLVEKHGMKIARYLPMWYDSFYVSMLSSKYKNGKTNFFSAFINGMRSNLKAVSNTKKCSSVIYIISK